MLYPNKNDIDYTEKKFAEWLCHDCWQEMHRLNIVQPSVKKEFY